MRDVLPQSVDPFRLAEQHRELAGVLSLTRLPRLAQIVVDGDNPSPDYASYALTFRQDTSGRALVEGRVAATLRLRCERCNGVLELPVAGTFTLAVVRGLDEAARLPNAYDPLLPEEATLDPATLVEDELLLAVPPVPRHVEGTCEAPDYERHDHRAPDTEREPAPYDEHPFAALQSLKRHH